MEKEAPDLYFLETVQALNRCLGTKESVDILPISPEAFEYGWLKENAPNHTFQSQRLDVDETNGEADRFSRSSKADLESFRMINVWPRTVTELIGP